MNMKEEHEIIMYTSKTCGYCNKMKEELEVANIPYTLKDHKNFKKEWDKIKAVTRSAVFPTFVIGNEYIIPGRDFNNPSQAITTLQYYQRIPSHESTLEDVVELLKNNMHMVKMLTDKVSLLEKNLERQHQYNLEERRMKLMERMGKPVPHQMSTPITPLTNDKI